ncbi:MAG: ATP-binding cassette domain-containing protein, partial [Gallionella sp.]
MPFITLDKASLAFGHVALLDHADFQLDEGERVGLIGRNGGGKSSMMRVLAGQASHVDTRLDDGLVWRAPTARICYVSQEPVLDPNDTVFDA